MKLHAVILAGGSGARFWPLSRELRPKQMLDVFGSRSLLVSAILRAQSVIDEGATINVVVGERLLDEVRNHLIATPELVGLKIHYIVEPSARNTAPALALAAATIKLQDRTGALVMLPSDHICNDDEQWQAVIRAARIQAAKGDLVTIGLRPTKPSTGYGYIKFERPDIGAEQTNTSGQEAVIGADDSCSTATKRCITSTTDIDSGYRSVVADGILPKAPIAYAVQQFVEKPDAETAERYLQSGNYLWNSGMLVARADTVIQQLREVGARCGCFGTVTHEAAYYSGKIASVAETLADGGQHAWRNDACRLLYNDCPSVPFDTACLEVSDRVSVVAADLAWSDVGSLSMLEQLQDSDESGNTLIGRAVDIDSQNVLSYAKSERVVATLGLNDVVVIDSADATLVAARDRLEDVRLVVDKLKVEDAPEIVHSRTSLRPWGSWTVLVRTKGYHVKELQVLPGTRLSLQSHEHRAEHWIVVEGTALVTCNGGTITLHANESAFLPIGTVHRLENTGEGILRVVEVATGQYLGEDDITRYDDDYNR